MNKKKAPVQEGPRQALKYFLSGKSILAQGFKKLKGLDKLKCYHSALRRYESVNPDVSSTDYQKFARGLADAVGV